MDDSTFRAFRRDPNFLKTILPIHDELNSILQAIFEVDPAKRITIPQLISRMQHCSRLTGADEAPISPPESPVDEVMDHMTEDALKTMPSLRLPSARYATNFYNGYPPSPPVSNPGTPEYHPYTSQTRYQYNYAAALAPQLYTWNNCVYPNTQQYHYTQYTPAYSAVY